MGRERKGGKRMRAGYKGERKKMRRGSEQEKKERR